MRIDRTLVAALLACALAAPAPAAAEIIDRVAAQVNAEVITLHDVRKAAIPFMLQQGKDPGSLADAPTRSRVYADVLDDLIERKLLLQEAAKLDLRVSDADLDQWLAYTRQQQGGLSEAQVRQQVEQYGVSYDDYKEVVRQNLLKLRITRFRVGSKVTVSDAEVDAAYRERYGPGQGVERYITVAHILIQPKSQAADDVAAARQLAEAALARIRGGESFTEVAKATSNGPSAASGGKLGTFRRGDLDEQFEREAFALDVDEVSDVVRTKFGFHVITVTGVEERPNPDIADRKEELRNILLQKAMERQVASYVATLRARAFIDVKR
jgi:peptidyl-prolyl cis-trans isomerase SurA